MDAAGALGRHQALAHAAGFHRGEAETLHAQGAFAQALQQHLQHDATATSALQYVTQALDESGPAPAQSARLRDAVLGCLVQLAQVSIRKHALSASHVRCVPMSMNVITSRCCAGPGLTCSTC